MDFIEQARNAATMAIPGPRTPQQLQDELDRMAMPELASLWCELQYLGLRDKTGEVWSRLLYFDRLPHRSPERALAMVLAVLRSEAHKSVKMQLNDKLMLVLVGHGALLIDECERQARDTPQLRWLIGGVYRWTPEPLQSRFEAIADPDAWYADCEAHKRAVAAIDFAALSIPALARIWVELSCMPDKDRDANWSALSDYERELRDDDPDRLLEMILEILRIEHHPLVLSYLAAGPLENLVGIDTIARIEREAAASEPFCALLGGVWYNSVEPELKARLDAIVDGAHGRNWRS
ncbi:MAG: hypothetical protein HXX15_03830 [Rhodopseudomonas sp.]|uniref:DUF6869 domain-containing protein n=1 Tax=Rhodopseudomonas sp. TaxID=1078 RepID=UPI00183D7679|nr:hypothetical protein [Rhodopseudomonas sp.]NVN85200.1 hypothetical protein [Rhodopseudomonas sp.]